MIDIFFESLTNKKNAFISDISGLLFG